MSDRLENTATSPCPSPQDYRSRLGKKADTGTLLGVGMASPHAMDDCLDRVNTFSNSLILGVGSLMSTASRLKSAPSAECAFPVWVKACPDFPWTRSWNFRVETGFTCIGLSHFTQKERWWNAVVFDPGEKLDILDERELGYRRVEIPKHCLRPFEDDNSRVCNLLQSHDCYVYVSEDTHYISEKGPTDRYPLLQSYIDTCMGGAFEFGERFAKCFVETTSHWLPPLFNDRAYPPERPMEQRRQIDTLLPQHLIEHRTGQANFALGVQSKLERLEGLLEGTSGGTKEQDNIERAIIHEGMWSGRGPSIESSFRSVYAPHWRGNHLNVGLVEGNLEGAIEWAKKASRAREPGSFKTTFKAHSKCEDEKGRTESVLSWDTTYRSIGPFNDEQPTGHFYQERHSNFYSWEKGKVVWECGIWLTVDVEQIKQSVSNYLKPLVCPESSPEAIQDAKYMLFAPFGFQGDLPTLYMGDLDLDTFVAQLRQWILTPPTDGKAVTVRVIKHILDEERNVGGILWLVLGHCPHGTIIGTVHHSTVHWKYARIVRMDNMWCSKKSHGENQLRSFFRGSGWEDEFEKIVYEMKTGNEKDCGCPSQ